MMEETLNIWYYKNGDEVNFGDYLGYYITDKLYDGKVQYTDIRSNSLKYVTIGSVLNNSIGVNNKCIVWGSGIMTKNDRIPTDVSILGVRGYETKKRLNDIGIECDVIGDPALMLKSVYNPVKKNKYKLGIIPHYVDYDYIKSKVGCDSDIKVIKLMTDDVEGVIDYINECEYIISSSLHGIIVSQVYDKPSIWVKFSDKLYGNSEKLGNNIKFRDYFGTVGITPYDGLDFRDKDIILDDILKLMVNMNDVSLIKKFDFDKLIESCPFKK